MKYGVPLFISDLATDINSFETFSYFLSVWEKFSLCLGHEFGTSQEFVCSSGRGPHREQSISVTATDPDRT
jgi:hypothetical protein